MISITVNIPQPIEVHVYQQDPRVTEVLQVQSEHTEKLNALLARGNELMGKIDDQNLLLDQINTYTNQMAQQQADEAATLQEIGDDLDALVSEVSDTTVGTRLTDLKQKVQEVAAAGTARAETLTNLAAKYEQPLPPPVEPEPTPDEPPVEPTPDNG